MTAGILLLACTAGVGGGVAQAAVNPATPAVASTTSAPTGTNAQPAPADVQKKQNQQILDHLNAVLHFYRNATAFTQKVGEPSDALYHDEALTLATQITQLAFQSAKSEATLFQTEATQQPTSVQNSASSATGTTQGQPAASQPPANSAEARQKHLSDLTATNKAKMEQLKSDLATVDGQMSHASAAKLRALTQQRETLQGQLDLAAAMQQALDRLLVLATTTSSDTSGLSGDIARLEHAVPVTVLPIAPTTEHAGARAATPTPTLNPTTTMTPKSVNGAESLGVVGQAELLFDLISNLHQMNLWMVENDHLRAQAVRLHEPLIALLRQTLQQGQTLAQSAPVGSPASSPAASKGATAPSPMPSAAQSTNSTLQQYEQLA